MIRAILDTNVIISALVYGGKPRQAFLLAVGRKIVGVISPSLLDELTRILIDRFNFSQLKTELVRVKLIKDFRLVAPEKKIELLKDKPDNRVLEAAVAGDCDYIVTGDKELLRLGRFQGVKIVDPDYFLNILERK